MAGFPEDAQRWVRQQATPVTIGLIIALVVSFMFAWFTQGAPTPLLALDTARLLPWTILTYPLADAGDGRALIFFLFLLLWLFWVGSSTERDLGSAKFAGFFALMTVLAGLFLFLGSTGLGIQYRLMGAGLPVAGLTVAWGTRNQNAQIRLYGIIPLTGKVLAILTVALTLFAYGTGAPLLGVFAVLHLAIAWAFAANKIPGYAYAKPVATYRPTKQQVERESSYFDDVRKREKEREERERLRKLFESSLVDDPDDKR
jgi:membrane associated rhomboid family serine protease